MLSIFATFVGLMAVAGAFSTARSTTMRKTVASAVTNAGATGRTRTFCFTSGAIDSDNDVIDPGGWDFSRFLRNPVALLFHNYESFPVGRWSNLRRTGDKWYGDLTFAQTPEGDMALALVDAEMLNGCSVGFQPQEYSRDAVRDGTNFSRQLLCEISVVPIPSNPDSLVQRVSALGLSASTIALVQKTFGRKAGRRHSAADQQHLDSAHDHIVAAGAACYPASANESFGDTDVVLRLADSDDVVLVLQDADPIGDPAARSLRGHRGETFTFDQIARAFDSALAKDLIVEAVSSALRDVPAQTVKEMARARGVIVD